VVDSDCAEAGKVCDPYHFAFGQCVLPCYLDGGLDCSRHGPPFCNPATGSCATCFTDQQCLETPGYGGPNRPVCIQSLLGSGYGVGGGSVCGCTDSSQCPGDTVCDQASTAASSCIPRCTQAHGGIDCKSDEDYGKPFCDPVSGLCGPCTTDSQCQGLYGPLRPKCIPSSPYSYPTCGCTSSDQCDPCDHCDLALGVCIKPCAVDGGASPGAIDCAKLRAECDPATLLCAYCLSDEECLVGTVSRHSPPVPICVLGSCTACRSPSDCFEGQPGCLPQLGANACGECLSDSDCLPGAPCDPATNVCRYRCRTDFRDGGAGQCPSGQPFCDPAAGVCWECRVSTDCPLRGSEDIFCDATQHRCVGEGSKIPGH